MHHIPSGEGRAHLRDRPLGGEAEHRQRLGRGHRCGSVGGHCYLGSNGFFFLPILSLSIEKDAWALGFWIILLDLAPPSKLRHSENDLHHIEYDYAVHECLR